MEDSCVLFFKGTFLLDIETRKYLFSPQLFSWQKPDKTFFSEIDKKKDGERIYKTYWDILKKCTLYLNPKA